MKKSAPKTKTSFTSLLAVVIILAVMLVTISLVLEQQNLVSFAKKSGGGGCRDNSDCKPDQYCRLTARQKKDGKKGECMKQAKTEENKAPSQKTPGDKWKTAEVCDLIIGTNGSYHAYRTIKYYDSNSNDCPNIPGETYQSLRVVPCGEGKRCDQTRCDKTRCIAPERYVCDPQDNRNICTIESIEVPPQCEKCPEKTTCVSSDAGAYCQY